MEHFGLVVPIRGRGTYIVPALLALSESDGSPVPQPMSEATPTATLHFALASSPRPDRAPFWSDGDLQGGFLPDGAFHELCGTAVGWSNHTARRFAPQLGRGFAHVKFGKDEVCRPVPPANTCPCAHADARALAPLHRCCLNGQTGSRMSRPQSMSRPMQRARRRRPSSGCGC